MNNVPSVPEPLRPVASEPPLVERASIPVAPSVPGAAGGRQYAARPFGKWIERAGAIIVLSILLFFALRNAPLRDILASLSRLQLWQIIVLLGLDLIIYGLITARWWFVVHAQQRRIAYLPLIGVRLSVFAISYFTLGPQVGGEPLQVLYLKRKYGLSYTRGTASVVMDKLFEVLANFILLACGLVALLHSGILVGAGSVAYLSLVALGILAAWPFVHIALLYQRIYLVSSLIRALVPKLSHTRTMRFVRASEHLAGQFCRQQPRAMLAGASVSLLAAAATVMEYALITSFLHVGLPFWQTLTAWTAGWLSFLVPLPGGLGALEASQVYSLGFFGVSAASAIGVTLVLRGRDLMIGGLGLLLAGHSARSV